MYRYAPHIIALTIGAVSSILAFWIGMPLPWMLGAMIGVTTAALAGVPLAGPTRMRSVVIPIIGVMLGSSITPEVVGLLGKWTMTILLLPIVLACMGISSYLIYRLVGKYDRVTAFYSAMPGGVNEMVILGGEAGGDESRIALAHAARILLVIFTIALAFGLFLGIRASAGGGNWQTLGSITAQDYLLLGVCALLGTPLANLLRFPAAAVFGPMLLSGIAHLFGWVTVAPPSIFIVIAQIVIGTVIGCRFIGKKLSTILGDLALAALSAPVMLIIGFGLAYVIAAVVGMPIEQVFLAFAPGGLTEMALLTLAIEQDVAFVSVVHLIRIVLIIAIAAWIFRILGFGRFTDPS